MIQFNPDGSIKLPEAMAQHKAKNQQRMSTGRCVTVRKDMVHSTAPKKCILSFTLSDAIGDTRFIDTVYSQFEQHSVVPSKLVQTDEKHFEVQIGSDFKRCTDCCSLVNRYREFLDGNVIEDHGTCPLKKKEFVYEDMFE